MPRGTQLSNLEKGQIQAFKTGGHSNRWIAKQINRSLDVVNRFVRDMAGYGKNNGGGRPAKLSPRAKRQIQAAAAQATIGSRRIRTELELNASHQTVWRAIQDSPNLLRQKMKKCPRLTDEHKVARVQWAEQRIEDRTDWHTFVRISRHVYKTYQGVIH
ncbi:tc3 transposase domain-containing protein [Ditylenchus destructor]|uniref:Tc3 transposase domain-containing protein n=1 Tax=Ditylenchus destructor TaxID=166010 RepID=A0AAD4ML57_9BILA|nr:tc3 transposase domain-containing protein [Ditylenchus destructor]